LNKQINEIVVFWRTENQSDLLHILVAVESSFKHYFLKQKEIKFRKFLALKDLHQLTLTLKATCGSEKFVLNLSVRFLTESEKSMLKKGRNFAATSRVSNFFINFFLSGHGMCS
jgi:23S rRNA maturation mini-RNase III